MLFFAPILQHEQVEGGQHVNNLLSNWTLLQNKDVDMGVFEFSSCFGWDLVEYGAALHQFCSMSKWRINNL